MIKKEIKKTKSGHVGFQFLNNYKNFGEKDKENCGNNCDNEEMEELNKKLEIINANISCEHKKCIENHKLHIDSLVDLMKKEMNMIDVYDNNNSSDVKKYVEQIMKIINLEEIKLSKIKRRFKELNSMLKERDNIEKKIKLLNCGNCDDNKDNNKDESVTNTNCNSSDSDIFDNDIN